MTHEEIAFCADFLADRLLALSEVENGDRMQSMTVAFAMLGVYSHPFEHRWVSTEDLDELREFVMQSGCFPLTSRSECVDALVCALEFHQQGLCV